MSKDNDDVMDFINSLPDSNTGAEGKGQDNEDFLEFLDELNNHETSGSSKGKLGPKATEKKPKEKVQPKKEKKTESKNEPKPEKTEAEPKPEKSELDPKIEQKEGETQESEVADPITSISSWWSSEGSKQVSSLWGSLTSNAHQLSESTYQLASQTSKELSHQRQKLLKEGEGEENQDQISHLSSRLNLILTTMSQQIKEGLIDREDELMNILLVHDLSNFENLDRLCLNRFKKVMGQVEGGIKVSVSDFNHKHVDDYQSKPYYDLALFHGKMIDGEKLCYANLDSSIKNYNAMYKPNKEKEEETKETPENQNVDVNTSDIFIAIQPITTGTADQTERESGAPSQIEANDSHSFAFTLILKDVSNSITITTKTQPFPLRWARWLAGDSADIDQAFGRSEDDTEAVDPSEWVKEWVHDGLSLAFGVVAQEYVTKRMGL